MSLYKQYFNFDPQPFAATPDHSTLYHSRVHREGLEYLRHALYDRNGFAALTSSDGLGKTILCHALEAQAPEDTDIILLRNPRVTALEFLTTLCEKLDIYYNPALVNLAYLQDILNKYLPIAHARGRRTVLVIDDAQDVTPDILAQIPLLGATGGQYKLLQIILVGVNGLGGLLESEGFKQLRQIVASTHQLVPLSLEETHNYVRHQLNCCGGNPDIFGKTTIQPIYELTGGVPKLINALCDRALLGAYLSGIYEINSKLIATAAKELRLKPKGSFNQSRFLKKWGWPVLWLLLVAGLVISSRSELKQPVLASYNKLQHWLSSQLSNTSLIRSKAIESSITSVITAVKKSQPSKMLMEEATSSSALAAWLAENNTELAHVLQTAAGVFNKKLPQTLSVSCGNFERLAIHCLSDRLPLDALITLQRPVILQLALSPERKDYILLKALHEEKVVLQGNTEVEVQRAELESKWDGNAIILWESPFPFVKEIKPKQHHKAVAWLRQLLQLPSANGNADYFDEELRAKVIGFQQQNSLLADGLVGGRTIINLQNQQKQP